MRKCRSVRKILLSCLNFLWAGWLRGITWQRFVSGSLKWIWKESVVWAISNNILDGYFLAGLKKRMKKKNLQNLRACIYHNIRKTSFHSYKSWSWPISYLDVQSVNLWHFSREFPIYVVAGLRKRARG